MLIKIIDIHNNEHNINVDYIVNIYKDTDGCYILLDTNRVDNSKIDIFTEVFNDLLYKLKLCAVCGDMRYMHIDKRNHFFIEYAN